jgi:hypothetical protein
MNGCDVSIVFSNFSGFDAVDTMTTEPRENRHFAAIGQARRFTTARPQGSS